MALMPANRIAGRPRDAGTGSSCSSKRALGAETMNELMIARLREIANDPEVSDGVRTSAERLSQFLRERQDKAARMLADATPLDHALPCRAADSDVMRAE